MSERILAQILADVAAEIGAVRKDERNTYQQFNFRGIDAVVNAVGPKLHKAGVIGPFPRLVDSTRVIGTTSKGNAVTTVTVTVEYTLYGPAGDELAGTVIAEAFDSGDKATAKAMSVAMRTFLLQSLCLPTDEPDPDQYTYSEPPRTAESRRPTQSPITFDQRANIAHLVRHIGVTGERLASAVGWASMPQGRVSAVEDMTEEEADKLIDFMLSKAHGMGEQEQTVLDVKTADTEEADE